MFVGILQELFLAHNVNTSSAAQDCVEPAKHASDGGHIEAVRLTREDAL